MLIWEAIKHAVAQGSEVFDFEGSMIEPIEGAFRSFGARQVPYFAVQGSTSRYLRGLAAVRAAI